MTFDPLYPRKIDENDLGGVSPTEVASHPRSVPADAASHVGHTPGPWYWSDGALIQTSHFTRDVWVIPRNEADQHLIAAAPELLEALKDAQVKVCAAFCPRVDGEFVSGHSRVCQASKAAIAKAEGRS